MSTSIVDRRRTRQTLTLVLVSGTFLSIFPVNHPWAIVWANHSLEVALSYLGLGLVFFLFNRIRLMYVCLACSAVICLYHLEAASAREQTIFQQMEQVPGHDSLPFNHSDPP